MHLVVPAGSVCVCTKGKKKPKPVLHSLFWRLIYLTAVGRLMLTANTLSSLAVY